MKPFRHLLFACAAAVSLHAEGISETPAPEISSPPPEDLRDAAKREAWTSAVLISSLLEQGDQHAWPGIAAWLEDFRQVAATTPPPAVDQPFPMLDADALVTRNPHFWAAFYEVQPGDPGLALLHAALLLSGGEAQRAAVIATLGLQRAAPEEIRRGLHTLLAHCTTAQAPSMELMRLGVRLHDMGEYETAVKQYDRALREWPANGCAHYERGSALRMQALATARKAARFDADQPLPDPPEALAAFAQARRHDPLHLLGYQGEDQHLRAALLALVNDGLPVWEMIRRKPEQVVKTDVLRGFSEACRLAGADDFALALRQLVVAANRHYGDEDGPLIQACLARLAPGAVTPSLLARVTGEGRPPTRQIVVPSVAEPGELAGEAEPPPKDSGKKNVPPKTKAKKKRGHADDSDTPEKPRKSGASNRKNGGPEPQCAAASGTRMASVTVTFIASSWSAPNCVTSATSAASRP